MAIPNVLPGQMFDHMLNPAKGWPHQAALDFQARISANVQYAMVAGQCAHLNAAGELEPGCELTQMPLFMFQGLLDLDVNPTGNNQWTPTSPSGRVMCLPGKGPYELETTEWDSSVTGYVPNALLTSPVGNGPTAYPPSGQVTLNTVVPPNLYSATMTTIVGCVSRGVFTNAYGTQVLAFWPMFLPGNV